MHVRINIGLDFDGNHTFEWKPDDGPGAVDIPHSTLNRWAAEREAFTLSFLRWRRVVEEIEEILLRAEQQRSREPALAVARASAPRSLRR